MFRNLVVALGLALSLTACQTVPAGNVGVKVYLLGGSKGVDHEVLGVGRYWIGINEQLYVFPTYQQNYVWTHSAHEGNTHDESFTFQTREGLDVNADIGITYHVEADKVPLVFQKYRRGIDEITHIFLRNAVRDALNQQAATMSVESVYGEGKTQLMANALARVQGEMQDSGITVNQLYIIGTFRLPPTVVEALNAKITATQRAQQRENELREAEAEAKKQVAKAEGEAASQLAVARAQAEANQILSHSLSREIIDYQRMQIEKTRAEKWDGKLPTITGGVTPFFQVDRP